MLNLNDKSIHLDSLKLKLLKLYKRKVITFRCVADMDIDNLNKKLSNIQLELLNNFSNYEVEVQPMVISNGTYSIPVRITENVIFDCVESRSIISEINNLNNILNTPKINFNLRGIATDIKLSDEELRDELKASFMF